MNQKTLLSLSAALMWLVSVAEASITNAGWYSLDYNLSCNTAWNPDSSTLSVSADQYAAGGMYGTFYTDTAADPKVTKLYSIVNESGSNWFGYNINVYMDHAFSISNIVVSLPGDWFVYSTTQPVNNGSPVYFGASEYVGNIILAGGSALPDSGELDFKYDVGFDGALAYRFADEVNPIYEPIPEPGILAIAGIAALLVVRRTGRR